MRSWSIVVLCMLPIYPAGAATVYRSVDADGKVVYSDKPAPGTRVERTLNIIDLPASPLPEAVIRYRNELAKSMQNRLAAGGSRRDTSQPALFTTKWCRYCKDAKVYLAQKRIPYREFDVETPEGMRALVEAGGGRGVPVLVWGAHKVQGFSPQGYDAVINAPR